jgi:dolichol kinase
MSTYHQRRDGRKKIMLRKLFHFSGIIIPVIYVLTDKQTALIVTAGIFVLDIVLETLRIKGVMKVAFIENSMKKEESNRLSGSFFYVLSGLITIIFFEKNIAVSSLCILSIADPLSSLLGSRFGKVRLFGKSLEGTMTFFAASFLILRIFSFSVPIAVTVAVIASVTELLSSRFIDDNLSIPLVTAMTLTLLARV